MCVCECVYVCLCVCINECKRSSQHFRVTKLSLQIHVIFFLVTLSMKILDELNRFNDNRGMIVVTVVRCKRPGVFGYLSTFCQNCFGLTNLAISMYISDKTSVDK